MGNFQLYLKCSCKFYHERVFKWCIVGVKYRSMYVRGKSDRCPFITGFVAVEHNHRKLPVHIIRTYVCATNCVHHNNLNKINNVVVC